MRVMTERSQTTRTAFARRSLHCRILAPAGGGVHTIEYRAYDAPAYGAIRVWGFCF